MDTFLARQPVFDNHMKTVAYSLYYRNSRENHAASKGDDATASVIVNGPLMVGYESLTEHKPALIKFTASLLMKEVALLLHPEELIVDIVEPIETEELLTTIGKLKAYGYRIAINSDYSQDSIGRLLDHVDIITIDFSKKGLEAIKDLLIMTADSDVTLMAYKVETREQYEFAKGLNFSWYQGNFFMSPVLVNSKSIRPVKRSYLRLMIELTSDMPDFDKVNEAVESDLALSYKLLRLVNSSAYSGMSRITDTHQAIVRIGQQDLFKWLGLVIIEDCCKDRPDIYVKTSILRGKTMENLGEMAAFADIRQSLFLTGMFSMIDIILEKDMADILEELPLNTDVSEALLGTRNRIQQVLAILIAYENMDWVLFKALVKEHDSLTEDVVAECYAKAVQWSQEL